MTIEIRWAPTVPQQFTREVVESLNEIALRST